MRRDIEEFCENIEAALFNGDGLHDYESLKEFREYLIRWIRKGYEIEEFLWNEEDKLKGNN